MIYFSHDLIMRRLSNHYSAIHVWALDTRKQGVAVVILPCKRHSKTVTFLKMRPHSLHTALQLAYATTLLSALASGQGLC